MLELCHDDMSARAHNVRAVAGEKGLAWTCHHRNPRAGDAQRPECLERNPGAPAQALVRDGMHGIESTLICACLEDAFPGAVPRRAVVGDEEIEQDDSMLENPEFLERLERPA
ncbi:MAG: glutathione S-transferase N-terminal domain-containing protein [Burkholderiales bacterium]|nr:glutathione S-transferase N-terminal domain-containing protein [Burkholderiales bacterium]